MYKFLTVVLLSILVSGCGILDPWIYKINKQQGNITEYKHGHHGEMKTSIEYRKRKHRITQERRRTD